MASRLAISRRLVLCDRSQPFLAHCSKLMLISNDKDSPFCQDAFQEMIACLFAATKFARSEHVRINFAPDLLGDAAKKLRQLPQTDCADDHKIDVAMRTLPPLPQRAGHKGDGNSLILPQ